MLTLHRRFRSPSLRALLVTGATVGLMWAGTTPMAALGHQLQAHQPQAHERAAARTVASAAGGQTLLIEGAGEGHGVGMSQDGAEGYATHGWTYQEILAHYYTGTALGQAPARTSVRVLIGTSVKTVPLEQYVRGVVSAEVPSSWPMAALEAQAVASRTYAITAHAGGRRFDVYADTRSQVYGAAAAETPRTNAAVAATSGQVVVYDEHPAITYFFASSGGSTENVEVAFPGSEPEPWLRGVADPYDQAPRDSWRVSMSFASAGARLNGLVKGAFRGIEVVRRGVSPRIVTAIVLGSAGGTRVSGATLAGRLGLIDTWAYFSVKDGRGVRAEVDRSGQARTRVPVPIPAAPAAPTAPAAPAAAPGDPAATPAASLPAGPQGGAQAPGGAQTTSAGGTATG